MLRSCFLMGVIAAVGCLMPVGGTAAQTPTPVPGVPVPAPLAKAGEWGPDNDAVFEAMEQYREYVVLANPEPVTASFAQSVVNALYVDWGDPAVNWDYQWSLLHEMLLMPDFARGGEAAAVRSVLASGLISFAGRANVQPDPWGLHSVFFVELAGALVATDDAAAQQVAAGLYAAHRASHPLGVSPTFDLFMMSPDTDPPYGPWLDELKAALDPSRAVAGTQLSSTTVAGPWSYRLCIRACFAGCNKIGDPVKRGACRVACRIACKALTGRSPI